MEAVDSKGACRICLKKTLAIVALIGIMMFSVGCSKENPVASSGPESAEKSATKGGLETGTFSDDEADKMLLDLSYGYLSPSQKLNVYLPKEGKKPYPVIIAIHGGAFKIGSRTSGDLEPMMEGLEHGYAVVTVDYRLSTEALFPAAVNDVKTAIRFIRCNAHKYNLDPERIAAWGSSAGGNLAATVGTTGGTSNLYDKALGYETYSDHLTAVVDWYGPIEFSTMDEQFADSGIQPVFGRVNRDTSAESEYLGRNVGKAFDLVRLANAATYASSDDPPFLIQHGKLDANVPYMQSVVFAERLKKALGPDKVELVLLPKAKHGGADFESEANMKLVFDFLDRYMKR